MLTRRLAGLAARAANGPLQRSPVANALPRLVGPSAALLSRRWLCAGGDMDVPIPELGAESISEGGILSIAKTVGDYVAAEELVAEIETGERPSTQHLCAHVLRGAPCQRFPRTTTHAATHADMALRGPARAPSSRAAHASPPPTTSVYGAQTR